MARIRLMHAKLHGVRVTDANVNYVGSVTIDNELIDKVGILPLQEVEIWNVSNGNRLSTYVLPGEPGSGIICLNGAASHLCDPGDFVIIAAYEECDRAEVFRTGHEARVVIADEHNRCKKFFYQTLVPCEGKLLFQSETTELPPTTNS
ncbi:MAG: aspartate 1-decarboxylase [Microcoleus sp. PH2017_29_MFU_D_A]|uniref:aspartate 1-decarboxylase n=1 Tax=unclassified Microcoleus TaxID=2642155 RepID=UPI001D59A14A|nr:MULTISPECIES: aspartate 1-decarboxylase [unclassified Microcoleus]MCC3430496.1 aspartate 1-decarboxylase [Microcoleus sp. PH2017_04_SCI_O_A]MCC3444534.1 aspartate 1-decarboxylase [Microcoleus sp. PH2017_03_ELD_O_A]MCC3467840.1 aspartate 1-decarboxylase [Microcoleus sp. PH2017_06_SFM_O_A]MCC3506661.1 aspartate 1-decarboxylase [Microcoleus sp. PH2017_19_SFW_U_A]TAE15450.1 MAG: aspartate 1-decarboxylase [Oscillatoriales cyanobacterium]